MEAVVEAEVAAGEEGEAGEVVAEAAAGVAEAAAEAPRA